MCTLSMMKTIKKIKCISKGKRKTKGKRSGSNSVPRRLQTALQGWMRRRGGLCLWPGQSSGLLKLPHQSPLSRSPCGTEQKSISSPVPNPPASLHLPTLHFRQWGIVGLWRTVVLSKSVTVCELGVGMAREGPSWNGCCEIGMRSRKQPCEHLIL